MQQWFYLAALIISMFFYIGLMVVLTTVTVQAKEINEVNRPICFSYIEGELTQNIRLIDRVFLFNFIFLFLVLLCRLFTTLIFALNLIGIV